MECFYAPGLAGGNTLLPTAEAHHIRTVLRYEEGRPILLIDGRGGRYSGHLVLQGKREASVALVESVQEGPQPAARIHLGISPLKNPSRLEWFLEKATELGVSAITPLIAQRSEKRHVQRERMERVLVAAMKQSGRSWLPELREPVALSRLIQDAGEECRMIAHCGQGLRKSIGQVLRPGADSLMLIGPEGDFDPSEVELAVTAGFVPVHLGPSRLRTETAGVAAVHWINLIHQGAFDGLD